MFLLLKSFDEEISLKRNILVDLRPSESFGGQIHGSFVVSYQVLGSNHFPSKGNLRRVCIENLFYFQLRRLFEVVFLFFLFFLLVQRLLVSLRDALYELPLLLQVFEAHF